MNITIYHTRPINKGDQVKLTKKNLHIFFNRKPVDIVLPLKTLFYELYQRFTVKKDSVLPFVWLHIETEDLNSYEIRVLHDQRYILFTPVDEGMLVRKLQSELTKRFQELYSQPPKDDENGDVDSSIDSEEENKANVKKEPAPIEE